jgi:DeoR family transcriptional regulator of aga operon
MASLTEFDREQAILGQLERHGRVDVNELAEAFQVSTVTIRKNLDVLERRGMLRRIRGGALSTPVGDEGAFEFRQRVAPLAKRAIARHAATFVRPGDVVAMDSSTTCFALAEELVDIQPLTVITNGLRVSQFLLAETNATVIVPGGVLRRASESMVGFLSDVFSGRGRVNKGFFGLVGLSRERGLLDISPEEAHAKTVLAAACHEVYALFDSSKVDRFGMHPFVTADRVTRMISDVETPSEIHAQWSEAGVAWDLVEVPTTSSQAGPAARARTARAR